MAGILHPYLMGGGQGLLAPPTPAAPMAQQSGGLLSMFMPEVGQNKFYQGFDRNRDALTNAFFGMVGQDGPRGAARGFAQGAAAGNQADQVRRAKMEEQQKARDQVNKTVGWLANKFGLSEGDAQAAAGNPSILNHYLKLSQQGTDGPASVQEWDHFNKLAPEDQERYLRMKRASPYLDTGTGFVTPSQTSPGTVVGPAIVKENYRESFDKGRGAEEGKYAGQAGERRSKALSSLDSLDNQRIVVDQDINRAIADIEANPGAVTGLVGGIFSAVPGSPAYALAQKLMTVKANIGFDKLQQMRENSPTGGALGQVSDFENRQLQSVFGSLEQANRPEDILYNLRRLQQILAQSKDARRRAFARDFGADALPAPAEAAPSGPVDYRDFFKE